MPETNFPRALILVARVFLPIAVLTVFGLIALHLLYLRNPTRTDAMRNLSVDHLIVMEQTSRAATLPAAEIAFLGDSSCLMGIEPPSMESALHVPVQSFCSIGYLGPAGYAQMLAGMIERNATPKVLIFVFHPGTFRREVNWESWSTFVQNGGKSEAPALKFPQGALDFLQFEWVSRLTYRPLLGAYGLYYGGEGAFRRAIRARHGGAVDPNNGLNISSTQALHAVPTPAIGEPADFSWNQAYRDALATLAGTLKKMPSSTQAYLAITPVPDSSFREGSELERTERTQEIAPCWASPPTTFSTPQARCTPPISPATPILTAGAKSYLLMS